MPFAFAAERVRPNGGSAGCPYGCDGFGGFYLVVRGVQGQILVHDLLYGCAVAERNQRFGKVRFSHTGHLIKGILCLFGKNDAEFFLQVVQTEPELLHALVMSFEQDVLKRGAAAS